MMLLFMGFVVVVCVISEAAGKAVDRQKGKAIVRYRERQTVERWPDTVRTKNRFENNI